MNGQYTIILLFSGRNSQRASLLRPCPSIISITRKLKYTHARTHACIHTYVLVMCNIQNMSDINDGDMI